MLFAIEGKRPRIHETAFIAPTASVIGDVTVRPNSSVWFGAVLRGDFNPIVVGAGTTVQDNVVLHGEVTIGDNCTTAHGAIVHDSKVGNHVMVAVGARIFGGCVIGDGALIGMGAVMPPRTVVEPDTIMLGVPAQPTGKVEARHRERQIGGPEYYVEWRGRYLKEGNFYPIGRDPGPAS